MDPEKNTERQMDTADGRLRRTEPATPVKVLAASAVEPGTEIGCYTIVSRLGEGGMGVVYKARDRSLERTVALKFLPSHLYHNPAFMQRFRTEARAQARLHSPNVVTLFQLLEIPAGLVLVMEYVEGRTLEQHIRENGPLDAEEAVRVFDQALRGVESAHAMGIIHCDLKPNNIFLTHSGGVKLMDFGIARILGHGEPGSVGAVIGTLLYIAPEQLNGRQADFRSDVYTLGISLFEAITGRLPFERKTHYGLMHAHAVERPPSPRIYQHNLPAHIEAVILKAVEKDPGRRFQTAAAFRVALLSHGGKPAARTSRHATSPGSAGTLLARAFPPRQIVASAGFDLALLAAIISLALWLGFVPVPPVPAPANPPQSAVPPAIRAPAIAGPQSPPQPAVPVRPAAPFSPRLPGKYRLLRRVWGGS